MPLPPINPSLNLTGPEYAAAVRASDQQIYTHFGVLRADIPALTILTESITLSGNTDVGDGGSGALYIRGTSAGPRAIEDAAGTWFELSCGGMADLGHFGAALDGETADDAAWDAAYDYLMDLPNGGTLILPAGAPVRLNAAHNIHPFKPLKIHWGEGSKILCGLTGASNVLLSANNPDAPTTRGARLTISGASVIDFHSSVSSSAIGAVFFEYRYASDLKIEGMGHAWLHYRNNTALRISAPWNCDGHGVTIWGAGHRKPRKSTGTTTFSIAYNTTTLTASASVFEAGDVGDIIVVADEMFVISAYTSATEVTVDRPAALALTSQRASFGSVRCSATTGDATVTLESAVAVSSDIGRIVYIVDAKTASGSGSPKEVLRATIIDVPSSTTIELDTTPDYDVSLGEIIFSPSVEIYYDTGEFDGLPNDIVWDGLHAEQFRGTGVMLYGGGHIWLPHLKAHGAAIGAVNADASDYCVVNSAAMGVTSCQLEGVSCGRLGRVLVTGLGGLWQVSEVAGAVTRGQALVRAHNMSTGGAVEVGNWFAWNYLDPTTVAKAFPRDGSGRIEQVGRCSSYVTDLTGYPRAMGQGRPPYGLFPTSTEQVVTRVGDVQNGLFSAGIPTYWGCGVSTSVEAPASTADYAPVARFAGLALPPTGTSALTVAWVAAVARSPSGSNVAGQLELSTRDGSGTLATRWVVDTGGGYLPGADNAYNIGWAGGRVKELFCANGTINTSDAREKQDIGAIPDAWLDAWGDVQWQRFRWIDAVAEKGEAARWHIGLIAQEIDAAFKARGLDASAIGLLCYDEWAEEPAAPAVLDGDGNESVPAREGRPAGSRWGVRYSECAALEAAWVRRALARAEV